MKKILCFSLAALLLGGCHNPFGMNDPKPQNGANAPATGAANPASVYCQQQGGTSNTLKDNTGAEYAVCNLPNGRIVEEWQFFRENHQ